MRRVFLLILSISLQYSLSQELVYSSLRSYCDPSSARSLQLNTRLDQKVSNNDTLYLSGTWITGCGLDKDSIEFRLHKIEFDTIYLTIRSIQKDDYSYCACEYRFNFAIHKPGRTSFIKINGDYVSMELKRYRMDGFKSEKYEFNKNGKMVAGIKEIYSENNKVLVEVFYENGKMVSEKFYHGYTGEPKFERKLN